MKALLALIALLGACSVQAQTNFDVLYCRDATYTNATIIRATPAYVVVDYQGGIAKVALTNLPTALQSQYHYDPIAAAQVAAAEKKREADARAALIAQRLARQKYLAALAGPTELITVESANDQGLPGGLTCEITGDSGSSLVLLAALPATVLNYVQTKARISARIDYLLNTPITATATVNDPNDPDPAYTAKLDSQELARQASDSRDNKVDRLKDQLKELEKHPEKATVRAYSTGQVYSQMMIWQCGESGK